MTKPDLLITTGARSAQAMTLLVAEDDDGHWELIIHHLREAGLRNPAQRFVDGEALLRFLLDAPREPHGDPSRAFLLLLDIRMPRVDGIEVLSRIKDDPFFCALPVIMLTTTDDPREVDQCYALGCNSYLRKPVDYESFAEVLRRLGLFIQVMEIPRV